MNKSDLLDYLCQENKRWEALLNQIGVERMELPGVNGAWSMKDLVAHLTTWNRWLVARLQAAQSHQTEPHPPWPDYLESEDEINAWIYETNHGREMAEILDESQRSVQQLLVIVESLPGDISIEKIEPAYYLVWVNDKRFEIGEFFDHFHDDHEQDVHAWLRRVEEQ